MNTLETMRTPNAFEFIAPRDFDTTPKRYAQYLRDSYRTAERTLELPVEKWASGTSHEISRTIMSECKEAMADLALDFGLFTADGKLSDYAEV